MPPASPFVALPPSSSPAAPAPWTKAYSSDLASLDDIAAGPSGLIAVGCRTDPSGLCVKGLMLTSPDGVAWTEVDLPDAIGVGIGSVRQVGDRLFALGGRGDGHAIVWTSLDGRTWTPIAPASFAHRSVGDVIASPAGALAVGMHLPYPGTTNWLATVVWDVAADGSFGQSRDVRPTGWENPQATGIVWTGQQFLGWGTVQPSSGDLLQIAVLMASPTGRSWAVLPQVAALRGAWISQIAAHAGRLVAAGYYEDRLSPRSPRVWTSTDDGVSWQAAHVPSILGEVDTVAFEGTQWMARGLGPFTWTSSDGEAWTQLPAGEDLPDVAGFIVALNRATFGARTCVTGSPFGGPPAPAEIYCR